MSKQSGWPKWIKIRYAGYSSGSKGLRYTTSANNPEMLYEKLIRLNITEKQILIFRIDDEPISPESIKAIFREAEKYKEEMELNEERKKIEEKPKN